MASVWPLTKDKYLAIIKQYLRYQKKTSCQFFEQKTRREKILAVSSEMASFIQPMPDIYNINSDKNSENGMPMTEEEDQELLMQR
ncbi:uncharacterized protein CIMG_13338 [Coccidioides immitis RS]|uniref:Uncharacterized protein n=1 Tax=Coccidioides immitis (strain RS) TaxID=246410 RepID=A0A0D8JUW6_COCIM|nr:uncharacterized protein CIMG_13338 [Coccidioides immitis RS]KJF60944.1 hypothetical protein CIMG_13338 [Coccidioides immitis RS]